MVERMKINSFLHEDTASVSVEYVLLAAFAAILMAVGVFALNSAMGNLFTAWASYFSAS